VVEGKAPLVLTAGAVAAAMGATLRAGNPQERIDGFSIDSRTISAGDLFFAIRGQRRDGHVFVAEAWHKGACGVVVSDATAAAAGPSGPIVLFVPDTVKALQALGRHIRRASGARVVAITGSAGKTTTKELTAAVLSRRYRVFRSMGNLNNQIGLPLSLLELRRCPEIAVVELGMSAPGEIGTLVRIAEPEVRVWTNVAEVHSAFFLSLDAIADAKAELLEGVTADVTVVANAADPLVMARVKGSAARVITFGIDVAADVRASDVCDLGLEGSRATVETPVGRVDVRTALLGRGNLANALAAMAVAVRFQVPLSDVIAAIASVGAAPHRGEVLRLRAGVTVIDDSYNSNPTALERALEPIRRDVASRGKIAVLGEMLELGDRAAPLHESCGRAAAHAGLRALITVGGEPARKLGEAAVAAGMPRAAVTHCPSSDEAAELAARVVGPGDLVLVKGSRGIRTDQVVERLKAEFG
jgi:UDP-N-acetylmuramoyl-tripeptide--D-alanyl-D-alanine ligase